MNNNNSSAIICIETYHDIILILELFRCLYNNGEFKLVLVINSWNYGMLVDWVLRLIQKKPVPWYTRYYTSTGVARIFFGGGNTFSKNLSKNSQKIFKKYSNIFSKNFQKIFKKLKFFLNFRKNIAKNALF